MAILGGYVCPNPYYEPPQMVLGEESEAERVKWMIERLRQARATERALEERSTLLAAEVERRRRSEELLRESEERYRTSIESMLDAFGIYSAIRDESGRIMDFRVEYVNAAACESNHMTREEQVGRGLLELLPAHRESGLFDEYCRVVETGEPLARESLVYEDLYGSRRLARAFDVHAVRLGDGFAATWRDVTVRKRAEDETAVRAGQMAMVAELGRRALATDDLSVLMDEAVGLIARTLRVDCCKVLELLPDGSALLLRAGAGWREGLVGRATVGAGRDSQAGYALLSDEPVIVEDLRAETRFTGPKLLHDHGVISGMSVIIQSEGRPFGALGAHTRRFRTFTRDDVVFLQSVANMLASAIQRKRAVDEIRRLNAELERRVAERTAQLEAANRDLQAEIAERRHTEAALRETRDYLENLFNHANAPIIVWDPAFRITRFNRAFERLTAYTADEVLGRELSVLFPEAGREESLAKIARTLTGEHWESVEIPILRRDGDVRIALWNSANVYAEDGRTLVATIAQGQDITERQRAERRLRASEERYRLLVESARDYAMYMLDSEGRIVSWSAGAERIKGYRAEEILGQPFSRFFTAEDIQQGRPERELVVAAAEGRFEDEGWRVRKDGSRFWANVVVTALRHEDGRLRSFSKVTRDMTERKQSEEEIRKLNADLIRQAAELRASNSELESFAYSVSHDLRAPLRSIDGFSQALMDDYSDSLAAEARGYLHRVRAASQRMGQLIDDILTLSRVSRSEMHWEDVCLSTLAHEVAADLRKTQPERQVEFAIEPGVVVRGDPRLLGVVMANLIGNAWKFTGKHPQARIEFGSTQHGSERAYFVRDDGAGFDMAYADKLFGAFQRLHSQTEFPGTGIGLATVQRIVRRHCGRIWAEGAPEEGATFYFTLGSCCIDDTDESLTQRGIG